MRFLLIISIFLSPMAFGQRVRENLKQQTFVGGNRIPDHSQFTPDSVKIVKPATPVGSKKK